MSSLRDFDSMLSNPRELLEKYVQSRLDVEKDFGCPIDDIISRNIQSESYMKLCNMDTKTLETKFVEMDFTGRYEEKLVTFMNTELKQRVLTHRSETDPKRRFLLSMGEIHDYLKNTLMFFAPLIRQADNSLSQFVEDGGSVLAPPVPKPKKKSSFREKVVSDYKASFTNHLKYSLLDDIGYETLLAEFIESEFPTWRSQVLSSHLSESSPGFHLLAFLANIQQSGTDQPFEASLYPGLVGLHSELGLLESHLWKGIEKYFVKSLQEVVQSLVENVENVKSILPFLDAYNTNYIERYISFLAQHIPKTHKNPSTSWKRRLERLKTATYLKEITSSVFEFIKMMDDEDACRNVETILNEVKTLSSPQDIEEICSKLKEEIQDRLLSEDLITDAIITFYFNIVKCLNIIDKEMLHYQEVVGPIRQYLTKRPDIIKAVISIWKDTLSNSSGDTETYRVLDVAPHQSHGLESDDDEAEADKWDVRNVEGAHEGLRKTNIKYKDVDKLSLLFEMFGSDADFIEEYENILAEKLLLSRVADINEEIKNIELLKLRFGEQKLIRSAVILRDVDDSHRFNTNARENLKRDRNLPNIDGLTPLNSNMLFTSSGYWPINNGVTHFTYPTPYAAVYTKLHEQFKLHKSFMFLEQHNNLGSVELELSFRSGGKQTFRCEPIQAILISQFGSSWNPSNKPLGLEELSKEINAQKGFVRSKMFYWVKKGVLREVRKNLAASTPIVGSVQLMKSGNFPQKFLFSRGDTIVDESTQVGEDPSYELVLDYAPHETPDSEAEFYGVNADELDNEQISRETVSSRDMQANLKKFEPKILAILTVNGPKKLQKLKCLLDTVYKPEGMNMVGMNELTEILTAMVRSRKISLVNDIYTLYKQ